MSSKSGRLPASDGATSIGRLGRWGLVLVALAMASSACGGSSQKSQPTMMVPQSAAAAAAQNGTTGSPPPDQVVDETSYRLAPGDLLDVKFPFHPEENERVPVRPDGRIGLQVIGDILAAGLTVKELEDHVVDKAKVTLRDPVVSIVIAQLAEHKVYVGGQVTKPGFVPFREGMTPLQAIVERGGFTDDANTDEVLYISRIGDQVQSQRLDLEVVMNGDSSEQVVMSPDDVIFVPRTFIGEADVWVDQWVRGLLPTVPRPGVDLNTLAF
jgi:protein involved in polysaccharide export with SLBB domain